MQKILTFFFSAKNISIYAIFKDKSFNDTLTNDIVSFEQLGPGLFSPIIYIENRDVWYSLFLKRMEILYHPLIAKPIF